MLRIVLVVGRKNSGKTAFLKELAKRAREKELLVGGVLSEADMRHGQKWRYWMRDVRSGQRQILATYSQKAEAELRVGPYQFRTAAFQEAEQIFRRSLECDVLFLDEYGPLEARGEGFRHILKFLLKNYRGILMITVRPALLKHLKEEVLEQIKSGKNVEE